MPSDPWEIPDLLRFATEALDRLDITYVVTGSNASMYFGEPRTTNDIDIVAALIMEHVRAFRACFPERDFYLSEEAMRDALSRRSMFNVIHVDSGLKIDFVIPDQSMWTRLLLARGEARVTRQGFPVRFASPEDVIVAKLRFYHEGRSDKHLADIAGIIRVSGALLDFDYVREWSDRFGLRETWDAVLRRADPNRPVEGT